MAEDEPQRLNFTLAEGHVFRHVNGKLHSENDAPAVIYADGTQWWYREGKIHRDGGPAVRLANGVEEWWQDNQRHRDGAPAVIYPATPVVAASLRGVKQWWTRGKLVKEEIPPQVARYRQMMEQAHKACFGG